MRRSWIPLLAAGALAGCSTPYSQLSGQRYYKAPIDTYPLSVVAVDGEHWLREPVLVDPGVRQVRVQGPPTPARAHGSERTITLDVKPCTRYWLVAVKPNRLMRDFDVKVDHEEPVPGCARAG
jgi:hypothetical protein